MKEKAALIFLFLLALSIPSFAQPPHIIQGYVYYDGMPIQGAKITLVNLDKGMEQNTTTEKGGIYIIAIPSDMWGMRDRAKLIVDYGNLHKEKEFEIDLNKVPQWINISLGANAPPVAKFTFTPAEPTDLDIIAFTDLSTDDGSIVSYAWDFGDGNTSTEQNPQHRYADNGTYMVKLTVTDDRGAKDTKQMVIEVMNSPPFAIFEFEPKNARVGEEIKFNASLSEDKDGYIVNYTWDFGDGNISHIPNPFHSYEKKGKYIVRLTVTDNDGAKSYEEKEIGIGKKGTPSFGIMLLFLSFLTIFLWERYR